MPSESEFHEAMLANPRDNALRLVFADWLEERGDLRGELIRLLHTLTQAIEVPDRSKLEDRLRRLVAGGVQPVGPFWTNSIGMKFAWIPAGTFLMGSPEDERGPIENETPHLVNLTKGYYLAVHPVTQAFWRQIMRTDPSHCKGGDLPVDTVSWEDCQEFLQHLGKQEGQAYRLPTEAEWEYACRAGTTTPFYFGDTVSTDQVNYDGRSPYKNGKTGVYREKTTPVGSLWSNVWGLYDMHGNLQEWCADWYTHHPRNMAVDPEGPQRGLYERVLRGGSFDNVARAARSACRSCKLPTYRFIDVGFRPAMTR